MDVGRPFDNGDSQLLPVTQDDSNRPGAAGGIAASTNGENQASGSGARYVAGASGENQVSESGTQYATSSGELSGMGEQAASRHRAAPPPPQQPPVELGLSTVDVASEFGTAVDSILAAGHAMPLRVPTSTLKFCQSLDSEAAAVGQRDVELHQTTASPGPGKAATAPEDGDRAAGQDQGSDREAQDGDAQRASPSGDYMPNEGFDSDGSETAGVYDVSYGAAGSGGANHVNRRLRRAHGGPQRRQSSGSSSGGSNGIADVVDENDVESGDSGSSSDGGSSSSSDDAGSSGRDPDERVNGAAALSSDSDSNGEGDPVNKGSAVSGGDGVAALPAVAAKQRHLPACPLVPELRKREAGQPRGRLPTSFAHHLMGSVNLVQRLQRYGRLHYHAGCVNTATFNSSGTLLTSGSDDMNIAVWDWARKRALLHFESGHQNNVFQSKFMMHSGDTQIVTSARDGQVRLAELSTAGICRGTRKLARHAGAAHKIAIEPDAGHTLLSAGEDGVTYQIDLREEKPTRLLYTKEDGQKVSLYSIDKNPCNPNEFVVSGQDQYIRIYDKRKIANRDEGSAPVKKFCPHGLVDATLFDRTNVTCCVYNYDGTEVLGTYNDDHIYLFNNGHSDGAEYDHVYKGHRNSATVKGVNFYGPRSEFIVSGSDCGNVFLWDKQTEEVVQFMPGDDGGVVNVLEPHPTCAVLATSGLDHDIKLWMPTAAEPTKLEGLAKVMRKNDRDRRKERSGHPQIIDGHMLWMIMQHVRGPSRRTGGDADSSADAGGAGGDQSGSDSSDDEAEASFRTSGCSTS